MKRHVIDEKTEKYIADIMATQLCILKSDVRWLTKHVIELERIVKNNTLNEATKNSE